MIAFYLFTYVAYWNGKNLTFFFFSDKGELKCLCDDHHSGEQCEFCVCKNGGNCTVSETGNIVCQ